MQAYTHITFCANVSWLCLALLLFFTKKKLNKINSIFLLFTSQCYLDLWACRHKCYGIRGMIMRNISNYCFEEFIIFYNALMWNIFEYLSRRDYCIRCKLWPLNWKKKKWIYVLLVFMYQRLIGALLLPLIMTYTVLAIVWA